ncbi:uncharacterized protein LOC124139532 isoform X1 [Haliotis rufescens]|uniref:uncharacterized protein LOC124139532 isoform X1 n=1 Tax=Haliotis rufescens TaxID=6454 RepID=UPI00201F4A1B|nr:uncharacterized protein LOC124139532 isoform X1 [Haliotis rufescens]XP_046362617.2 uncharacterized protein LOC124139532 isoform X1 [Haliotis rufescens]XP_046362618.2 uncharacterized protein LOC124139532 isoform X1 [Haliotis rufescens]XP_046362619.2 uncharacterized protein LOC124139532 isoform X1 [Haliotis rufescens]
MTLNLINLYMTMERYTRTSSSRCASGRSILLDIDDALERLSNHSSPINRMHVTVKRSSTAIPEMAPNSVYSQLGVISPFPVRGLPLPVLQGKFVSSKSKTLSAMNHVTPGRLQRSKTILSTPCRHCVACTVKHLRNFNKLQSGVGIRIEDGMVYGMKRSKSDLHLYDDSMRPGTMSLLTGERAPVFMMGAQEPREDVVGGNKEEVLLPMATLTKKGLIKLTSLDQELPDQEFMSMKKHETAPKKTAQKGLIKRKDMRDQIRAGAQMLEEERRKTQDEEEDDGEVRLEDYTIGDLQTALDMVQENPDSPVLLDVEEERSEGGGQGRSPKPPKQPLVTESIKQQTFQLPILGKK